MKKRLALLLIPLLAAAFAPLASADSQPIYKWTDAAGVLHYSDKPPKDAAADLQTLDLPAFPPQDPAKIAADQAALAASTAVMIQQQQAEETLQQHEDELALERAQLAAEEQAMQQGAAAPEESAPVYPIYANSAFIPRSYRRNLYIPHRSMSRPTLSIMRPVASRPPVAVLRKP